MAICDACEQEMTDRVGCTVTSITYDDGVYQRFRVRRKRRERHPAHRPAGTAVRRTVGFTILVAIWKTAHAVDSN
jgi:hypothetical protein